MKALRHSPPQDLHLPWSLWAMIGGTLLAVLLAAAAPREVGPFVREWALAAAFATASVSCVYRAVIAREDRLERCAWAAFGAGLALYAAGSAYFNLFIADDTTVSFPSTADYLWAGLDFCAIAGLLLLGRARRLPLGPVHVLDGFIVGMALIGLVSAVVYQPIFEEVVDQGIAFGLYYPVAKAAVLSTVVIGFSLRDWRLDPRLTALAAGFLLLTAGDCLYVVDGANGDYANGSWTNVLYASGTTVVALAPWFRPRPVVPYQAGSLRALAGPLVAGLVGVGLVAALALVDLNPMATTAVVLLVVLLVVRLTVAMRDYASLLATSRREALTDPLTGLGNRRALVTDLGQAAATSRTIAVFDLDGFKGYNDTHGHAAGDRLLSAFGGWLRRAVEPRGRAYRMGGDEFCLLVDSRHADAAVAAAAEALTTTVAGAPITCSWGRVDMPREAASGMDALRLADARMYAMKNQRPESARSQLREVLVTVQEAREPDLHDHSSDVARLAESVARRLACEEDEVSDILHAAHLHDVGKIALPESILHKPGPLTASEWAVMRGHTKLGERLLAGVPALAQTARLVRSSHERWDGKGYPDGLRGERIPLGSRIIFVCDAYSAMVTDRPYRPALGHEEALQELRNCAGTQFDPVVVEAFLAVVGAEEPRPAGPRSASLPESARP